MKVPQRMPSFSAVTAQRRVLIVDDHPIVRQGLRRMIAPERAPIAAFTRGQGHDLGLLRDVPAQHPELPMLVLSMHDELIYSERLLAAGASGYIMKQAASDPVFVGLGEGFGRGPYL